MTDTRSRRGCAFCRQRHRKCDEAQPRCKACEKRNIHCEYGTRLQWASNQNPTTYHGETKPSTSNLKLSYRTSSVRSERAGSQISCEAYVEPGNKNPDDQQPEYFTPSPPPEEDQEGSDMWMIEQDLETTAPLPFQSPGEAIAFTYSYDGARNPYRRLSGLALASPVLLNTIISLATEYMYYHGHMAPEMAMLRHQRALASLREALVSGNTERELGINATDTQGTTLSSKQATLAAVLLQIANVVFIGGVGVDAHLSCASHFLLDLDYIDHAIGDFIPRLLVQRFAMIDVVTSILRRRRPHLPLSCWIFQPNAKYDRAEPSFREMTGCPQPILGFLARISHLAVHIAEENADTNTVLLKAFDVETELRVYATSRIKTTSTRTTLDKYLDILSQCFYWSAHLVLQRAVYRDVISSLRVQQTVSILVILIKSMPVGCGPDSSLPFPFYLSSREAIHDTHREWVRSRNQQMKQVYPGRARDGLMKLLESIWTLIDDGNGNGNDNSETVEEAVLQLEIFNDVCIF